MPRPSPPEPAAPLKSERIGDLAEQALTVVASRGGTARGGPVQAVLLARLVEAALGRADEGCRAAVRHLYSMGVTPEALVDDYIPAAARRMGEEWVGDTAGFAQVTLGTSRLMSLLREVVDGTEDQGPSAGRPRASALVIVPQGAQHTLGAAVLVAQVRRAGVSVRLMVGPDRPEMMEALASESPDVLMISASIGDPIDKVRQIVQSAMTDDGRDRPRVIVGGTITHEHDDLRAATGADLATTDVREALRFCSIEPT